MHKTLLNETWVTMSFDTIVYCNQEINAIDIKSFVMNKRIIIMIKQIKILNDYKK